MMVSSDTKEPSSSHGFLSHVWTSAKFALKQWGYNPLREAIKWCDHTPQEAPLSICEHMYHMQGLISTYRLRQINHNSVIPQMFVCGDNSSAKCSVPCCSGTSAAYFLALCKTETFTLYFLITCKWLPAAGLLSSTHCLLVNKRATARAPLFSWCILSPLKLIDWERGPGNSSRGDKAPERCSGVTMNNEQVAHRAATQIIGGGAREEEERVKKRGIGAASGVTAVISNPPMSFIPTDEKIRRGSHIVCYALQHPIRPHTMHINITFKQNGRERTGGVFHVLELSRLQKLRAARSASCMKLLVFGATLHCFLLVFALSSEVERTLVNCRKVTESMDEKQRHKYCSADLDLLTLKTPKSCLQD